MPDKSGVEALLGEETRLLMQAGFNCVTIENAVLFEFVSGLVVNDGDAQGKIRFFLIVALRTGLQRTIGVPFGYQRLAAIGAAAFEQFLQSGSQGSSPFSDKFTWYLL